jgi:hypothetical protein
MLDRFAEDAFLEQMYPTLMRASEFAGSFIRTF